MPSYKVKTRTKSWNWLIGYETPKLRGENRLPTLRSVFQFLLSVHTPPAVSIREACGVVIDNHLPFWVRGGIPTVSKKRAVDKLKNYHDTWNNLKRHCNKPATKKRETFVSELDKLFDIGVQDETLIEIPEDRLFYQSMKADRKASMTSVDNKWVQQKIEEARKQERKQRKIQRQERLKRRSDEETGLLFSTTTEFPPEAEGEQPGKEKGDADFNLRCRDAKPKVMIPNVTSAMDRAQLSDGFGSHLVNETIKATLKATAAAVGDDSIAELKLLCPTSTVRRKRCRNREIVADAIKSEFHNKPGPFFVHWDGKLIPEGEDNKKYDRVPVLVTGYGEEQLLGVPRLDSGSGKAQADATYALLQEWGLIDKTVGTVFDTTSTNTGCWRGCCLLLESLMGKKLLHCACRHHVFELILEAVTTDLLGVSKDPKLPFFAKLCTEWNTLDLAKYRTAASTRNLKHIPEADEIIIFCQNQLEVRQPRGDYKEFLKLVVIFLGGALPQASHEPYRFKKPGALSKTRWMMRAIYALKTWMLGKQLKLSKKEDSQLFALSAFVCKVYVETWFTAPHSASAPRRDLALLKVLYKNCGLGTHWRAALRKFSSHLWYLSTKLICFSLFDDGVTNEEKREIVKALRFRESGENSEDELRAQVVLDDSISALQLHDFASTQSMAFFTITGISNSFLDDDPVTWKDNSDYQTAQNIVCQFRVVNDVAERAVQLISKYMKINSNKLTSDENQRQLLMLVVAEDRKNNKLQ